MTTEEKKELTVMADIIAEEIWMEEENPGLRYDIFCKIKEKAIELKKERDSRSPRENLTIDNYTKWLERKEKDTENNAKIEEKIVATKNLIFGNFVRWMENKETKDRCEPIAKENKSCN